MYTFLKTKSADDSIDKIVIGTAVSGIAASLWSSIQAGASKVGYGAQNQFYGTTVTVIKQQYQQLRINSDRGSLLFYTKTRRRAVFQCDVKRLWTEIEPLSKQTPKAW